MATITHNNSGNRYRIAMDIAKEGSEVWDLTPYFKGRVGDNLFGLQVVMSNMGQLIDATGMKPYVHGQVGKYSFDDDGKIQMAADAADVTFTGEPDDCGPNGQVTYHFPEQMFPKEGIFYGFIGLMDDSDDGGHAHYTGVDVWFRVLGGVAQMGHSCDVYISELDQAITNFREKIRQVQENDIDQFNQVLDQYKQKLLDALAAVDDPKAGLMARMSSLETMAKQVLDAIQAGQFHEKANQYATIADLKADATLMAGDSAIVKGAEDYNDGHGAVYAIRSKRTEDQPDGVHLIALDNGTVAERNDSIVSQGYLHDHGIFPNAGTVKLGTAHLKLGDDQYPQFSVRIYQYGAGIPQPEGVDIAGGTASYDVQCRVVRIDPETVDVYLSPEHYTDYFSDYHLDSPEANCGGDSAYLYTGISCMQVQVHGAEMTGFDVATGFKC